jgi:hypothetical protein
MADPGIPILINPINGEQIADNSPTLSFIIPTDADNNNLVFKVELDTNNPIQPASGNYLKYESRLQEGAWRYDNGSGFVEMPAAGVGSAFYGNTAMITIPVSDKLSNNTWYWKISVSDQLGTVKFGTTATFGCNIFG